MMTVPSGRVYSPLRTVLPEAQSPPKLALCLPQSGPSLLPRAAMQCGSSPAGVRSLAVRRMGVGLGWA